MGRPESENEFAELKRREGWTVLHMPRSYPDVDMLVWRRRADGGYDLDAVQIRATRKDIWYEHNVRGLQAFALRYDIPVWLAVKFMRQAPKGGVEKPVEWIYRRIDPLDVTVKIERPRHE